MTDALSVGGSTSDHAAPRPSCTACGGRTSTACWGTWAKGTLSRIEATARARIEDTQAKLAALLG